MTRRRDRNARVRYNRARRAVAKRRRVGRRWVYRRGMHGSWRLYNQLKPGSLILAEFSRQGLRQFRAAWR